MDDLSRVNEPKNSLLIPYLIIGGLFMYALIFSGYEFYTWVASDNGYTICEVVSRYSDSKGVGRNIRYSVNGKEYTSTCFSKDCISLKVGTKCLIKFTKDDPKFHEVMIKYIVKDSIDPPSEGWDEIPEFYFHGR